jgi:hypothetical protein
MVPVAVSIWLSAVMSLPVASLFFCSRSHASTTVGAPLLQSLHHALHVVLGNREHGADRLQLRDDDDAVGVGRAHDVAGIDLAQADASADGAGDLA